MNDEQKIELKKLFKDEMEEMIAIARATDPHEKSRVIALLRDQLQPIQDNLKKQDDVLEKHGKLLERVEVLLDDKDFWDRVWIVAKKIFNGAVVIGGAWLLAKELK